MSRADLTQDQALTPVEQYQRDRRRRRWVIAGAAVFLLFLAVYWGVVAEVPVDYADAAEHFKYGSIGSDSESGLPYWIWAVMPELFPDFLPDPDAFRALPPEQRTAQAGYA
jgi:hypothetical protein